MKLATLLITLALNANLMATPLWELEPHFVYYRGLIIEGAVGELDQIVKDIKAGKEVTPELIEKMELNLEFIHDSLGHRDET